MYNSGDTSTAFLIDSASSGRALYVNHHDTGTAASVYINRSGNSASPAIGLSVTVANAGAGGTTAASFNGGKVDLNSNKIVNVSDQTSPQDAATKACVDTTVTGLLEFKGSTDASANPSYRPAQRRYLCHYCCRKNRWSQRQIRRCRRYVFGDG